MARPDKFEKVGSKYIIMKATLELPTVHGTFFLSANDLPKEWLVPPSVEQPVCNEKATKFSVELVKSFKQANNYPMGDDSKKKDLDLKFPSLKAIGLERQDINGLIFLTLEAQATHIVKSGPCLKNTEDAAGKYWLSKDLFSENRYSCFLPPTKEEKLPVKLASSATIIMSILNKA